MRLPLLVLLPGLLAPVALAQTSFSTNLPGSCPAPGSVRAGDLDLDGAVDVVTTHGALDRVCVNRNLGGGTAWTNTTLFAYPTGSFPAESAVAQLAPGGRPDIAVVLNGPAQVAIHLAAGAWPAFAAPQFVPVGGNPIEVEPFDYDLDGNLDLVVLCNSPNALHVLRNTGGGIFAPAGVQPLSIAAHALATGDLNADGRPDVVVTGSFGTAFADVLINTSVGAAPSFAPEQLFGTDYRPFGVCIGDLNGDGYNDIATANAAFSTVDVLLNQPAVLPGTTVAFAGTNYPLAPGLISGPNTEIDCADLDCDGDVDLAVSCNASSRVACMWNNGVGAYPAPPAFFASPNGCGDLLIADLSGDGQGDIATANAPSNNLGILLNNLAGACCRHILEGGISDGFAVASPAGPEDACPSPALVAWAAPLPRRDFDGPRQCRTAFLHTFRGLPGAIKSARLRMRMRNDCDRRPDDVLRLGFDAANGNFAWSGSLTTLTGTPWVAGAFGGVSLDLANLPGGSSLLSKMAADGRLDIAILEDTAVDSIYLEIESCSRRGQPSMFLNVSPFVWGSTVTWSVSSAPNSPPGSVAILLGNALGNGPLTPAGNLCLTSPSLLTVVPTTPSGTASFSLPLPPISFPPCVTLSSQALGWDGTVSTFGLSNTYTHQLFD